MKFCTILLLTLISVPVGTYEMCLNPQKIFCKLVGVIPITEGFVGVLMDEHNVVMEV